MIDKNALLYGVVQIIVTVWRKVSAVKMLEETKSDAVKMVEETKSDAVKMVDRQRVNLIMNFYYLVTVWGDVWTLKNTG